MDLPVNPDPEEYQKIRRAFKTASVMRWTVGIVTRLVVVVGLVVGGVANWYWGGALIVAGFALGFFRLLFGRCPRCGRAWRDEDLESFVCSGCRLNIGRGL